MYVLSIDPFVRLEEIQQRVKKQHRFEFLDGTTDFSGVEVILTAGSGVGEELLPRLPDLTEVITAGTGTDHLDISKLDALGITVTNVPEYCTAEVSDHAVAMTCSLFRSLPTVLTQPRTAWQKPRVVGMKRFSSVHVGVLGTGRIGRAICRKLNSLGMQVSTSMRPGSKHSVDPIPGVRLHSFEELLPKIDALIIASPGDSSEPHLLNREMLNKLQQDAFIVNVSRASLVDLDAMQSLLRSGHLAGAFFDVWDSEPPNDLDTLLTVPNLYLAPHNGWYSPESERALWTTLAARLDFLETRMRLH